MGVRVAAGAAAVSVVAAVATGHWLPASLAVLASLTALLLSLRTTAGPDAREATGTRPDAAADGPGADGADRDAPRPATTRLPASPDPAAVIAALFETVEAHVPVQAAHLWVLDEATATLRPLAMAGPRTPASEPLPLTDPVLGAAVEAGTAVFRAIARVTEQSGEHTVWRFAVPVDAGEHRGAVALDVVDDQGAHAPVLQELTAAARPSLAAAIALQAARTDSEAVRVLLDVARDLSARLCAADVVETALRGAMRITSAATGSVMLAGDDGLLRIHAAHGLPYEVVEGTELGEGEGIAGWVHASGTSMLVEDQPGRPASRRHGVRTAACVPIVDEHGRLGVINVGSRRYPARFTRSHLDALEALGRQTAVAIRNAWAMERSEDLFLSSLQTLAMALETKDPYSVGAAGHVAGLAVALGRRLGLSTDELQSVQVAGTLHDIGMGLVTGGVGASSRPLTTVDRGLVRAHPRVAAELLADVPALAAVAPIVYHHHEHFDGSGYDAGLSGEEIPLGSRILAVADAWVSMRADRPYRRARDEREALDELSAGAGSQFDPQVVEAMVRLVRDGSDPALRPGSR